MPRNILQQLDRRFNSVSGDSRSSDNALAAPPVNPLLQAALDYARRGYYVLPMHTPLVGSDGKVTGCSCEGYKRSEKNRQSLSKRGREAEYNPVFKCPTPGKHPRLTKWEDKATVDPEQIRRWWGRRWQTVDVETGDKLALYPNIGIATGKSGLLIVDLDEYKDNYAGDSLFAPADEATVTTVSGSGGRHLWFKMPENAQYGNQTGSLPAGIDIRGHGGLIIAAPSLHPSGQRYTFSDGRGLGDMEPQPLPPALRSLLDAVQQVKQEAVNLPPASDSAPDLAQWHLSDTITELIHTPPPHGKRSEADFAVVCALISAGATTGDIVSVFTHYPIGAQGKYAQRGEQYLARTIGSARAKVEAAPDIVAKLRVAREYWRGADGIERLRARGFRRAGDIAKTLDALFETALIRGTKRPFVSTRLLGEASNNSHMTAFRHLHRLEDENLVDVLTGEFGTQVDLTKAIERSDPTVTPKGPPKCVGVTVGSYPDVYADNRTSDAFTSYPRTFAAKRRHMKPEDLLPSLGGSGLLVWRALYATQDALSVAEIAEATGLSEAAVRAILKKFRANELVVVWKGRPQRYELHPAEEGKLEEQISHMTTYGVGKMREYRNHLARSDWYKEKLKKSASLDERSRLEARRAKYDARAYETKTELEEAGFNLQRRLREPKSQLVSLDISLNIWLTWNQLSDLPHHERYRYLILAGFGRGEIDRALHFGAIVGKEIMAAITAPLLEPMGEATNPARFEDKDAIDGSKEESR